MGIAECYTVHLEKHIDRMFELYSPVPTYSITDTGKSYGLAPCVIRLPDGHVTPFTTIDAEYKFWATVEVIKQHKMQSHYAAFVAIVTDVLKHEEYNDDVADTIDVLDAVLNGVQKHAKKYGNCPTNARQFVAECMENGIEFALE